ncbi:MAG: sigma-70 family RNA polymerase sigma factor [Acidobacteria bacterium]|nr:sigma-70 family RNA polymerase sigma factor [Acidobacteriota bacterium]
MESESIASSPHQVTHLLLAWNQGDSSALEQLIPLVHEELHRLARKYMRNERPGHVLQTTALIHEAYLRLIDVDRITWQNRAHFFAVSARVMRRILVDFARARQSRKRGGDALQVTLGESLELDEPQQDDLVALDDALKTLAALDPRKAQVVELRYFGGLSVEETAEVLAVSPDTVMRDWKMAKLWLFQELSKS